MFAEIKNKSIGANNEKDAECLLSCVKWKTKKSYKMSVMLFNHVFKLILTC